MKKKIIINKTIPKPLNLPHIDLVIVAKKKQLWRNGHLVG